MLFATVGQWKVFLAMMVAGLLAGGVYDLLAALRHLLRAGPLISLAADHLCLLWRGALFSLPRRGRGTAALRAGAASPLLHALPSNCAQNSTGAAPYRQISSY